MITSLDVLYLTSAASALAISITLIWAIIHWVRTSDRLNTTVDEVNEQLTISREVIEAVRKPVAEFQSLFATVIKPAIGMGAAFKAAFDAAQEIKEQFSQPNKNQDGDKTL